MRIDVPWSTGSVAVEVDDERVAGVLSADVEKAADPEGVLRAALDRPDARLEDFLAEAESPLLIVINDATRPTPSAQVLGVIRAPLESWLSRDEDRQFTIVIATGTHRAALPDEVERLVGAGMVAAHGDRVVSHDCRDTDSLVHIGRTSRGIDVEVNSLLTEARSLILINSVEPHYFAGYTGGRKSLFPGLAGYDTVWANHRLSMEEGSESLMLEGNPVHEDFMDALELGIAGKQVYAIQLVLDKGHDIGFAATGSLEEAFPAAISVAEKQFVLELERRYEVVVAVAPHPMDCNLYQTNKAIQGGAAAIEDGGILIVVSECPFGFGENQTLFDRLSAADSPSDAIRQANLEEYRLGVQQATRIAAVLERAEIWTVTTLADDDVRSMFMTPMADVQAAVDEALSMQGPDAQVLFLTEASITVPRVRA